MDIVEEVRGTSYNDCECSVNEMSFFLQQYERDSCDRFYEEEHSHKKNNKCNQFTKEIVIWSARKLGFVPLVFSNLFLLEQLSYY